MSFTFKHPLPIGTRVHHRGGIYSYMFFTNGPDDLRGHEKPGSYWGVVVGYITTADGGEPRRYPDGSYEYIVDADPVIEGGSRERQWASYHIDRAILPERTPADWIALKHPDQRILDPDGWRPSRAEPDGKSMDEPITEAEFECRWASCTIGPARTANS